MSTGGLICPSEAPLEGMGTPGREEARCARIPRGACRLPQVLLSNCLFTLSTFGNVCYKAKVTVTTDGKE